MSTTISNLSILFALQNTTNALNASALKLSTGLRINSAGDDPSGLAIANELQTQIDGYDQAISDGQDSTNLLKTATGAYTQITSLLNTINQNVLQAQSNLTLNPSAVAANQAAIQYAITAINNIAGTTSFGSKNLLDGSAGTAAALTNGTLVAGISTSGQGAYGTLQSGAVTLTVTTAATAATATGNATYSSVNATLATVNGGTSGAGGTVSINGQSVSVAGSDTVQTLIGKINAISGNTGVSAAAVSGNGSVAIQLTQANYGTNYKISEAESSSLIFGAAGTGVAGVNAVATVQAQQLVNGVATTITSTLSGGYAGGSGLQLSDGLGNSILLTQAGNNTSTVNQKIGQVSSNPLSFQVGITGTNSTASLSLQNFSASSLGNSAVAGQSIASIDVTSSTGATNALAIVKQALAQVNTASATVGSFQTNVIGSAINVFQSTVTNLSASVANIQNVDVAKETANYNKLQQQQSTQSTLLQYSFTQQSNLYKLLGL